MCYTSIETEEDVCSSEKTRWFYVTWEFKSVAQYKSLVTSYRRKADKEPLCWGMQDPNYQKRPTGEQQVEQALYNAGGK